MKTIFNYFLLSVLVPVTIVLTISLLSLQVLHWTAFNPNFYKSTLQQANIYSMIESKGTWQTVLQTIKILPTASLQNNIEQSIDTTFSFIRGEQDYLTITKTLKLVEDSPEVLEKRLEPMRSIYNITLIILRWLYILVPLLTIITGWLFIKSWLHFLKVLAFWSFVLGIIIAIIAGVTTNYIPTILTYLLPDKILGLDPQVIVIALIDPLYYLFQQIMLVGIVLTVLGIIIQIYMYWISRSKQQVQKALIDHPMVLGQKKMPVAIQNKKNKGVNPFDPRTFN